jgi:SAM-dependent methyltransferase
MDGFGPANYGDGFADVYDDWYAEPTDTASCVERLATMASGAPVLELGVGTGRLALPLAARGLVVTGIDASTAMLDRLRAKPGAEQVHLVLGDMADLRVDPPPGSDGFGLVVVAYNTFFNLADPADQQRCLGRVAALLAPGGSLVLEAFVPDDEAPAGGALEVRSVEGDRVVLSASRHDPLGQLVRGQHIEVTEAGVRLRPWLVRYLRPDQIDALAADAGLALVGRWSGWRDEPFDDASTVHVSEYRAESATPTRR